MIYLKTSLKTMVCFLLSIASLPYSSHAQCNIEITAEVVNCSDALNTFNALITVTGTGVGNSFVLGGNGVNFGSFSYSSSPIEIGPFTNNGTTYNFAAIDNTTLTCFDETQILPFESCPLECILDIVDVEFLVCDGLERYANIYIENNPNVSENFTILINQVPQGVFNYGQDVYTIGPLDGNCTDGIAVNAFDNMVTSCSDFYWQPGPWCCPDECTISDVIVDSYCVNDFIAGVIVDFSYNGASNERFEILVDNVAIDTSWVFEFPDTIFYNFTGMIPESITQNVGISHVAKPNCGFSDQYTFTCETIAPCSFSNVVLSPIACVGEDTYSLGIDFQVQSATSLFFDVYSEGNYLGAHLYSDLPIVIDNFPARDADFDIIRICDNGNNSCCETVEFEGLECEAPCNIFNYFVEAHECDTQGQFNMYIQFETTNVSEEGFVVRGNGIVYDTFQYDEKGWYVFGPLTADCVTDLEFIVIDLGNPDCTAASGVGVICCEVEMPECQLSNLSFDQIECDGDFLSLFYTFDQVGTTNDFYDLLINGSFVDFYEFNSNPQALSFPYNGSGIFEVTICENDNPDCCVSNQFEGPACNEDECNIREFFIEARECNEAGLFEVDLEFAVDNPSSSSFSVFGDGNNYGSFEYGEAFYTVGPFEGDCSSVFELVVVDNDEPACTSNFLFIGPICCEVEECEIRDLVVTPIECIGNDLYSLNIDFNYSNTNNDFFDVFVDGENIGFYNLNNLPIILDYPASGNTVDVLSVCINDNLDCCSIAEFEALECMISVGDCGIFDVFAEAYECDEEGQFLVDIDFEFVDASTEGFEIRGNGTSYGEFQYGESFYTIGPLSGDCQTIYEFIIIDLGDETCFNEYGFDEPICCEADGCGIFDVFAEAYECDEQGEFLVDIEFGLNNAGLEGFEIRGNGTSYGEFQYGESFYTIGPISGDCETIYEFIVIDLENETCSSEFGFSEPICCEIDECVISNLEAELINCDSSQGIFFVSLSFDSQNLESEFFNVTGNDDEYGSFGFGQESYTLGPLDADGITEYEFVVSDLQNESCTASIDFGIVECISTSTHDISEIQINIYHQKGILYIDNPSSHSIIDLQIFNLDGKFLFGEKNISNNQNVTLGTPIQNNGIYVAVLKIGDQYFSIKFPIIE